MSGKHKAPWGGPLLHAWQHVHDWDRDAPGATINEYLLWSDAEVWFADLAWRKARFLNTGTTSGGHLAPALIVRWQHHESEQDSDQRGTPAGLSVDGEIAALLSLATGARIRSGGIVRTFRPQGDPYGLPMMWTAKPAWIEPDPYGSLIPSAPEGIHVWDIEKVLDLFVAADERTAVTLASVAREYASALWIADADPDLAWLLLVSALETAAEVHRQDTKPDPSELLREAMPAIADLCESFGAEHLAEVAGNLRELVKSTRRFLDFTAEFLPDEPNRRPDRYGRVDWDALRPAMSQIYALRSSRLHAGATFPAPMRAAPLTHWGARCEAEIPSNGPAPAHLRNPNGSLDLVLTERPTDFSLERIFCGQWAPKEVPMHLHTFADLTRRTLLKWADFAVNGRTAGAAEAASTGQGSGVK